MLLQAIAGELVSEYNHEKSLFLVCLSAFLYPWGIVSSLRSKAGRGRNTDITERPKGTSCEQSKHRLVEGVSTVGWGSAQKFFLPHLWKEISKTLHLWSFNRQRMKWYTWLILISHHFFVSGSHERLAQLHESRTEEGVEGERIQQTKREKTRKQQCWFVVSSSPST